MPRGPADAPRICCDPGYRHSIRAYRYRDGATVGLPPAEVGELFAQAGAGGSRRSFGRRTPDRAGRETGKAAGVGAVRRYLGCQDEPAAAIGDSERGRRAARAVGAELRSGQLCASVARAGRPGPCRVMRERYQRGLLEAVRELVGETGARRARAPPAYDWSARTARRRAGRRLLEAAELSRRDGGWAP